MRRRLKAEIFGDVQGVGFRYFAESQALFVMTARFARSYWKYQRHAKAYAVVLMDAAHLSQTFYLLCADLGLGAFVTAAINNAFSPSNGTGMIIKAAMASIPTAIASDILA